MKSLGVNAEPAGRSDLVVDGRKISGSAYKVAGKKNLHHGTMLFDVDFSALDHYLNPYKIKLATQGVQSASSRVMNLKEIDETLEHEKFCQAMAAAFGGEIQDLDLAELQKNEGIMKIYNSLKDEKWVFGEKKDY